MQQNYSIWYQKINTFFNKCINNGIIAVKDLNKSNRELKDILIEEKESLNRLDLIFDSYIYYDSNESSNIVDQVKSYKRDIQVQLSWGLIDGCGDYTSLVRKIMKIADECDMIIIFDEEAGIYKKLVLEITF